MKLHVLLRIFSGCFRLVLQDLGLTNNLVKGMAIGFSSHENELRFLRIPLQGRRKEDEKKHGRERNRPDRGVESHGQEEWGAAARRPGHNWLVSPGTFQALPAQSLAFPTEGSLSVESFERLLCSASEGLSWWPWEKFKNTNIESMGRFNRKKCFFFFPNGRNKPINTLFQPNQVRHSVLLF